MKDPKASHTDSICQCASCILAKQKRKSEGSVEKVLDKSRDGDLKKNVM